MAAGQAEVTNVTVPVAIETVRVPWKLGRSAPSCQPPITWHVTHVTGLGDLLWLMKNPEFSIVLSIDDFWEITSSLQRHRKYIWINIVLRSPCVLSNEWRIFLLRDLSNAWGCVFPNSGQDFTTGRSSEIWGNFSKISNRIIKNMKNYGEIFWNFSFFARIVEIYIRLIIHTYML